MNDSMISVYLDSLIHNPTYLQESGGGTRLSPDKTESSPPIKFGQSVQILKPPHPGHLEATDNFTPNTSRPVDNFSISHLLNEDDLIIPDWFSHADLDDIICSYIFDEPDDECTIINFLSTETQPVVQSSSCSVATVEPLNKSTKQPVLPTTENPESTETSKSVIFIDLTLEDDPISEVDKSSQTKYKTSLQRKKSQARYAKSTKGRLSKARYTRSDKGKASQARRQAKYLASDKGKKKRAKYLAFRKDKMELAKKTMHSRMPIDQL